MNNGYLNRQRVPVEEHAILFGGRESKLHRPSLGRRGKHTPQQKYEQFCKLLEQGKVQRWRSYLDKHYEVLMPLIHSAPKEVFANTPVEKNDIVDPWNHYEYKMDVWRERCTYLHRVKAEAAKLSKAAAASNKWAAFNRYVAKHQKDLAASDPVQPVAPEVERVTPPKLDGRTGFRKQASKKTKALTNIQKHMAEEKRKWEAEQEEKEKKKPRPVMAHHTTPNAWLNR
jgi:hypothetical protein